MVSKTGRLVITIEAIMGAALIIAIWFWPQPWPEQDQAARLLAIEVAKHPILRGAKIVFEIPPKGYTACVEYKTGRIIISPYHGWELKEIIEHECAHLIDYRSDGHIDYDDTPKGGTRR